LFKFGLLSKTWKGFKIAFLLYGIYLNTNNN